MSVVLSKNLWTFMGHFLKPYKRVTLLFVCFAMLTGLLVPLTSVLVKKMIDILETAQTDAVLMAILWPAILFVANFQLQDLCWRGMGCLNYKFQPIIKNQMLKEIFAALHQHKHQFFQQNLAGRISSQINTLADNGRAHFT